MRLTLMFIAILLTAVAIAFFAAQNPVELTVRFFGWYAETSLAVVVVMSMAAGGLLVGVITMVRGLLFGFRHREALSRVERLQKDNEELSHQNQELTRQIEALEESLHRDFSPATSDAEAGRERGDDPS